MSSVYKLLLFLQSEMVTPKPYGWFHFLWIGLTIGASILLYKLRKNYSEKQLKTVLLCYGVGAFVLELLKQIIWAFNYDALTGLVVWDFEWYAFPFQLCSTPIYVSLICLFLKKGLLRDSLFSYMSYFTILGSIMTILIPDSCFTSDILVNIHTMFLHCGSLVVSVYLLMNKEVLVNKKAFIRGFIVFLLFVYLADLLNIIIYNSGILNGESFNMFYISPYFMTHLPVFNVLQSKLPYLVYLLSYILILLIGALIIYVIAILIKKFWKCK